MVMHNPPHSGGVVREFCIKPLGLSATEAAKSHAAGNSTSKDTCRHAAAQTFGHACGQAANQRPLPDISPSNGSGRTHGN